MGNYNKRNQGVDLLRVVLMTTIVLSHILIHGKHSFSYPSFCPGNSVILYLTTLVTLFPVDCFVFISGYYGISLKSNKTIHFICEVLFYSLLTFSIGLYYGTCSLADIYTHIFPISNSLYWFFTNYLLLMLLSPMLNQCTEVLSKRKFVFTLLVLYVSEVSLVTVTSGKWNPFGCFLFMYLLGRYFQKYLQFSKQTSIYVFISALILQLSIGGIVFLYPLYASTVTSSLYLYSSPVNILLAVSIFYIFKNTKFNVKLFKSLVYLSSSVFAVYLFTDSLPIRYSFNGKIAQLFNSNVEFVNLVGYCAFSFFIVLLFSALDKFIFCHIYKFVSNIICNVYVKTLKFL